MALKMMETVQTVHSHDGKPLQVSDKEMRDSLKRGKKNRAEGTLYWGPVYSEVASQIETSIAIRCVVFLSLLLVSASFSFFF